MLSVSKEESSTIFWVFAMNKTRTEPGPLANTLTIGITCSLDESKEDQICSIISWVFHIYLIE